MTTARVLQCSCGGVPEATVSQVQEDLCEAVATCPKCGKAFDPIEHVWGGVEARMMAYQEWNDMRRDELRAERKSRTV